MYLHRIRSVMIYFIVLTTVWGRDTLTVGVQDFHCYLPYSAYDGMIFSGFERELLDLFATKKGYYFHYTAYPIKRLDRAFVAGNIDIRIPDNPYWAPEIKSEEQVLYSAPLVSYIDGVVVQQGRDTISLNSLDTLGVVRGFTPKPYLPSLSEETIYIHENSDISGLLKQVAQGRIDGAYINVAVAYHHMKQWDPEDRLVFAQNLPFVHSTRHLSTIHTPQIIDKFNTFLEENASAIELLKEKYRVEEIFKRKNVRN
ncbi:substrate-binding periplasmic protein [Chitinivibrio alkaliphilus]|uniref:Periplasmic binding protein n=1 Tax=Chitinivibrio alkaliphilus ACht1 TaxID=1313304 RepID=U7D5U0_9BACT|nr:transporter substrate-binding domain-containing protein [Chitinivibrio alkaliphilus]ERP30926.1 periplasmic binding protein [Chitinivibrio alkaliphilus ACht1]